MNEMKHTPGPWTYHYDNSDGGDGQWYAIEATGNYESLFSCSYNSGRLAECEANARLAASAPDLLEATRFVLAYLDGHKCINNEEQRAVLAAAIAKATKESP